MNRLTLIPAALLALMPTIARAAELPCMTPEEFAATTRFALPSVIDGINERCAPVLPEGAFLREQGGSLAARYAQGADDRWSTVRGALARIAAGEKGAAAMLRQMPDPDLKTFVRGTVRAFIASRVPVERCHSVNQVLRLIAPLAPNDTADLIATAIGFTAAARGRKLGPIAVCPA